MWVTNSTKNHTHVKKVGHTYLRISFWHLSMNLKNKLLLKKLLSWANKNKIILTFTMLHFFKKYKNTCRYHYQNLDDMIYSSWDIKQNILKLVILGHFLPFYPLKTPKIRILKMKNLLEISSFYTCIPKNHNHMMYDSWDIECNTQNFCQHLKILSFYKCLP